MARPINDLHARMERQHHSLSALMRQSKALNDLSMATPGIRVHHALALLENVMTAPERLGAMTEQYYNSLFLFGQQALQNIADSVSHHCGNRTTPIIMLELRDIIDSTSSASTKKDSLVLNLRRSIIQAELTTLSKLHNQDLARLQRAARILQLCSGAACQIDYKTLDVTLRWKMCRQPYYWNG